MKNVQHSSLSRAIYTIFALSMLLSSCVADRAPQVRESQQTELEEGEPFTVEMSGFGSSDEVQGLRGVDAVSNIADIKTLRVLVFNEDGKFLYSQEAILGDEADVSTKPDADFMPTSERKDITRAKRFKVTLLKSNKPRRIHFIANYNWTGFDQDYFLSGISDGDLVSSMLVDRSDFTPMWGRVIVPAVDQNTLKEKVIVLLRSYAKVTIDDSKVESPSETEPGSLKVTRFLVCNYPEGGTLAPFVYTPEHKYEFKYGKTEPTIVPGVKTIKGDQLSDLIPVDQPFNLHEWDNKDHNLFLIIEGRRTDKSGRYLGIRYYKLDFVSIRKDGAKEFIPILRNNQYSFKITKVLSDGYKTLSEAVGAPATNNVFAAVELEEFTRVSDGETLLEITPIVTYAVRPSELSFQVITKPETNTLKYVPRWDPATDPYLGALTETPDGFKVVAKGAPTDSRIEYRVDVICTSESGDKQVSRPVKIILSSPFKFNAKLERTPASKYQRLTFEVSKYLKGAALPIDIYIEAKNLTPRNNDPRNKLELTFKDKKIYYRYSLRDTDFIGKKISFDFLVNDTATPTQLILRSEYYEDQTVALPASR